MTDKVRTRFAPSPTGALHLGGARTALLNALWARKHGGVFLLRFEDTDAARSRLEFARAIEEDLAWLGIAPDRVSFQSRRHAQHEAALASLAEQGLAYRCFCSPEQLERDRALARAAGRPPRYAGRCRRLAPSEAEARAQAGESFVWRLAAHAEEGEVRWQEMDGAELAIPRSALDDPILVRSSGSFTFLLPNAIDDAEDGISHVIRGEDQRTNTAYQLLILQALKKQAPVYQHISLIVDAAGRKLSKREADFAIAELRRQGWEPEAVVQWLVRLGMPNLDPEALSLEALAEAFSAERLSRAPVRVQQEALAHWNERVLQAMDDDARAKRLALWLPERAQPQAKALARLLKENLTRLSEVRSYARLWDAHAPIDEEAKAVLKGAPWLADAAEKLAALGAIDRWLAALKQEGRKGKALFLPLRAAVLGRLDGPPLMEVLRFLGAQGVHARILDALEQAR